MAAVLTAVTDSTYERALERAQADHLVVIDLNIGPKEIVARVHNPKNGEGYYTVRYTYGAPHMTCNCQAGQAGTYCKHRAIVRVEIRMRKLTEEAARKSQTTYDRAATDAEFDALMTRMRGIAEHTFRTGRGSGSWR